MKKEKKDVFKVEKGYGFSVNLENSTLSYFKDDTPSQLLIWPSAAYGRKLGLEVPIRNIEDLKRFMIFLSWIFSNGKISIREIDVTGPTTIVCVYC
jgi:hypothetical protein